MLPNKNMTFSSMLLSATDYDGGRKCQVRFDEGNAVEIVPGSQVRIVTG